MGDYDFTVSELNSLIKKESKMNLAHLGNTATDQNTYIFPYMTQALWKYAEILYRKKISSPLTVATSGYVTFQISGVNITDMYAPIKILNSPEVSGSTLLRRSSFDAPAGWFKESANDLIHIKGTGTFILHYRALHAKITADTQSLDIPMQAVRLIQYETLALIFHSLNDDAGATSMRNISIAEVPIVIAANMASSASTTGGVVPSQNSATFYR